MKRIEYRSIGTLLIAVAVLFFLFKNQHSVKSPIQIGLNVLIAASFTVTYFVPKSWWTITRLSLTACLLLLETAAGIYLLHEPKLIYILALVLLSILLRRSMSRSATPAVVTMIVVALLFMQFGHQDVLSLISFVLLAFALYVNIRSRMQKNEIHALNKQQLIELQDAYDQLQAASVKDMHYAVVEERTRIARDIHDAVGHSLTSLIVQMQAMRYMLGRDPEHAAQSLEGMLVVARQGLKDIRTSVHALADDQSSSGLLPMKALLSRMKASTKIQYSFFSELTDEDLNSQLNELWFRVLQEAITNVIRHANATEVQVRLGAEPDNWTMRIRDNGTSTPNSRINEGFGLMVMRARLEDKGGSLNYGVLAPSGFEVVASIPKDRKGDQID
jgi:signal transduction histidine kinase